MINLYIEGLLGIFGILLKVEMCTLCCMLASLVLKGLICQIRIPISRGTEMSFIKLQKSINTL